jgi:ribonuclease P protein component
MQRLQTRAQFQAAMAGGTVSRTPHFALHRLALCGSLASPLSGSQAESQALFPLNSVDSVDNHWVGAMAPKRWARRAVTRNTIKRQIYSVAPLFAPRLLPAAYVVRLRTTFDRKQFISARSDLLKQAVRTELLQLFERALA